MMAAGSYPGDPTPNFRPIPASNDMTAIDYAPMATTMAAGSYNPSGSQSVTPRQMFGSSPSWAYNTQQSTSAPSPYNLALNASGSKFFNSADPYVQAAMATTAGNLAGAQQATAANRVNQNTPYANLQYQQTGTDAYGNPIWSANQSLNPAFQGSLNNLARSVNQTTQNAFNPNNLPSMGINPGETYSDAILRRLQPQSQMQQKQFDTQMANQGITPGSEAYANAKRAFDQQQNDLLTSAQVQGIGVGQTANQQAFNQQLATYNNPLQQLGAFQAATTPGYVNPAQQATVAGPDILGATATSNAAALAQQNANIARTTNMQNGLYGLGNAALVGAGGLGGLGTSIINGLSGLGGLFGNNWNINDLTNQYGAGNVYYNGAGTVPDWANFGLVD